MAPRKMSANINYRIIVSSPRNRAKQVVNIHDCFEMAHYNNYRHVTGT